MNAPPWSKALTLLGAAAICLLLAAAPLAAQEAEAGAAEAGADESQPRLGWPREYTGEDWRLVVYQPQIENWKDYLTIEAYLAVMLTPPGSDEAVPGAVKLRAGTDTHLDSRTVFVHDVELVEIRIPEIEGTPQSKVEEIVRSTFPDKPVAISLDRILAGIAKGEVRGRKVELNDKPPAIFVSQRPAILVNIDGDPAWVPTGVEKLSYAANTNWDLFQNEQPKKKQKKYYLRNYTSWLGADDLAGPWGAAGKLPKSFNKLPMNENFSDAKRNVPGTTVKAGKVPAVFVSTEPAELILIDGEPELAAIPDTAILYVENTESDVFRHIDDGHYYYLVAGRWFKNDDFEGAWSAASGKLPAGFEGIPEDHAKGHALSSVPGTEQAEEAVLEAQIPTVAKVGRADAAKEAKVDYVGDPEFRDIEGTELAYAVNTPSDVIRHGDGTYYLCQQGVWFKSSSATGPWMVADNVPDDIYEIPASSPVHHTTYVYVYDSTPTEVVYGYTSGYMGLYVSGGCAVWGTGWYYSPYYYYDPFYYPYPIYYGYPYTYGAGTWYNPTTGFYGRGYAYYGPYGGAGRGAAYNPATGTYARGGYAYGAGGGTAWGSAYNPRTGTRAAGYRSSDIYSSWGQGVVSRGDQWLKGGYYSDARGSVRGFQDSSGRAAGSITRGDSTTRFARGEDNVYVGKDGNVYRRGENGWDKYGGKEGGWENVGKGLSQDQRDAARDRAGSSGRTGSGVSDSQRDALRDLDRSAASRQRGNVRSDRYRSSSGWGSGSRGGMSRGGGMRRGGGRR